MILKCPLGRLAVVQVKDIEPVFGIDFHTEAVSIGLIQVFFDATGIVFEQSPVLDELNHALLEGGRACL
jgi:hypothetical protein